MKKRTIKYSELECI